MLVAAGRNLRGQLWAHHGAYLAGLVFLLSLSLMLLSWRAIVAVRFAFGAVVYRQAQGLPTEGLVSDLGGALLLGMQDGSTAIRCGRQSASAGAPECAPEFAAAKYLDGMVLASRELCTKCLFAMVATAQPSSSANALERRPGEHLGLLPRGARSAMRSGAYVATSAAAPTWAS